MAEGTPNKAKGTVVAREGVVGQHSFLKEEQVAFCEHINNCLGSDAFLKDNKYLPLNPESDDLFRAISDGILLSKLINVAQPETIDERALNYPAGGKALNPWETTENQNIVINSAKAIGCQVVNIHAKDLMMAAETHKEYLVLGLVWQVVKVQLLSAVSIKEVPQLFRLLQEGEQLSDMLRLPPEEVLLRWVNYHLAKDGTERRISNFSSDLKDGDVYLHLLHSISPDACTVPEEVKTADALTKATRAIDNAKAIEVPAFIHPADVVSGNRRLNLAFVAQIFNHNHGLDVKEEELKAVEEAFEAAGLSEDAEEDAREERVFRLWMNSLNLGGGERLVHRLFNDMRDGLALLEAEDKVQPGCVDWAKVNKDVAKLNTFKKVENCNLAVNVGKGLGFSLPGVGGVDIANGNPKLTLGFVWQLMRLQTIKMLQDVGGGAVPKDADVLAWANAKVKEGGRESAITSFKDSSLSSGIFLLDLLYAVEPRAINPAIPTAGESEDDKVKNAKYVLSVARKIGAQVFCTWEDITQVKPKMLLVLTASILNAAKVMETEKALRK